MHGSVLPAAQTALTLALTGWMITGFTRLPGRWRLTLGSYLAFAG
ncbi:hypothetical protein ACFVSN_30495 [Kitasatospora sp. NPDC057904]